MDTIAALAPPVVVALAFIAVARAAIRHTDGASAETDDGDQDASSSDRSDHD